jgi:hypothetical protein
VGLLDEKKTEGRKSRATVPLIAKKDAKKGAWHQV